MSWSKEALADLDEALGTNFALGSLALRRHQLPHFGLSNLSDDELKGRGIHILEDEDILYG
jgi:hypothetical protein